LIYIVTKNQVNKYGDTFEYVSWGAALSALRGSTYLFIDIETTGLNFLSDAILSIQVSDGKDDQYVFMTQDDAESIPMLFDTLNSSKMLVGHNIKFDLKFLRTHGYHSTPPVYDTMLCEQILVNGTNERAGLHVVTKKYCDVELDKSIRKQFCLGQDLTPKQIEYGANDVKYLDSIMRQQTAALRKEDLLPIAKLECQALLAFLEIEYNGLGVNTERWMEMIEVLKLETDQLEKELNLIIDTDPLFEKLKSTSYQTDLFCADEEVSGTRLNWNSSAVTLKAFRCVDPSIESTGEQEAFKIGRLHAIGKILRKHREKSKKVTSFGVKFLDNIYKEDNHIHPRFTQIKRTGRVSCREPNMQQIPAHNDWRNCFITDPGHVFVSADYSSQELCVIAHGSKDPVFNEALEKGHDLHSVCAELVFGAKWKNASLEDCAFNKNLEKCNCPEHKKLRTTVKTINFGLAYGMGPGRLAETMDSSVEQATALIEKYFKAFPKIKRFLEAMSKQGVDKGYIKTFSPWRRTRWFPDWKQYGMDVPTKRKIERISKNTPIQGTAADMTKHALVLCNEYIKENNIPVKLVMTVHDQIDTTCEEHYAEEWAKKLTELMEQAATHIMGNTLLKAETEITKQWSK